MFYLLQECSLVETQHPAQPTVHWSHHDRVDQWPWLAVADKPESRYPIHKTDMGVISRDLLKNQITSITLCFGGPWNDAIKYRFLVYSSTTTCNSHAKVDLFNNCRKIVYGACGIIQSNLDFSCIVRYNIHKCIYTKLDPEHFPKCQL